MWISALVMVLLLAAIFIVFWGFLAGEKRADIAREITRLSGRRRVRCSICSHIYEDYPTEGITQCPICKSYNRIAESGSSLTAKIGPPAAPPDSRIRG